MKSGMNERAGESEAKLALHEKHLVAHNTLKVENNAVKIGESNESCERSSTEKKTETTTLENENVPGQKVVNSVVLTFYIMHCMSFAPQGILETKHGAKLGMKCEISKANSGRNRTRNCIDWYFGLWNF